MLLRYLAVAQLARIATEGARVGFVLLALERGGGAGLGGALVAAMLIPHVIAAPLVGAYGDRTRRPRLLYFGALSVFGASLAGAALLVGRAPTALVLALVALGGCCAPLATGGLSSLLRDLIPDDRRARAYSLDVSTYSIAGIAGPAVVALIAAVLGPGVATLVTGGVAIAAGALVIGLPLRPRIGDRGTPPPILAGIKVIWSRRTLRAITVAGGLGSVAFGVLPLAATMLAAQQHATAATGVLVSAFAVGGLTGSLLHARFPIWADRPARLVIVGQLIGAVPLLLVPIIPSVPVAVAMFALSGITVGPVASALFAARELYTPPALHTQVFTFSAGLRISLAALGAALAGATAGLGAGWLVALMALGNIAGAAGGAWLLREPRPPRAATSASASQAAPTQPAISPAAG